jgi:hypothetical protein
MDSQTPTAFEITRIGQQSERIAADSCDLEGTPPTYVFRKSGDKVHEVFSSALERQPTAIYPKSPEEKAKDSAAWQKFVRDQGAANQTSYLDRE